MYPTPVYMPALEKRDETGHYLLMKHYWCVSFWRLILEISHQTKRLREEVIQEAMAVQHIDNEIAGGISNWWLYSLSVTDRTNIVCFIIFMMISATLTGVVIKMKLPTWKLQMVSILLHDFAAVILLIVRLTNG